MESIIGLFTGQNDIGPNRKLGEKERLKEQLSVLEEEKKRIIIDITELERQQNGHPKLIDLIKESIEYDRNKKKKYEKKIEEIDKKISNLKLTNGKEKTQPLYTFGIESFDRLENLIGPLNMDRSDLRILNTSNNNNRKNYYLYRELTTKDVINNSLETSYYIDTKNIKSNAFMVLIVPIQENEIWKKNIRGFNSNTLIMSNNFDYPAGTVGLIPKNKREEINLLFKKNPRYRRVICIEYDGDNIINYARALVKMIEGYDPQKCTKDSLIKRYSFLENVEDNYFEKRALIDIVDFFNNFKDLKFNEISGFLDHLNKLEKSILPKRYSSLEVMFKYALGIKKDGENEDLSGLIDIFHNSGYTLSEEGIKLFKNYLIENSSFKEATAKIIKNNKSISKVEYKGILTRNIINYVRNKISYDKMLVYTFMEILAFENGILDIKEETENYYKIKDERTAKKEKMHKLYWKLVDEKIKVGKKYKGKPRKYIDRDKEESKIDEIDSETKFDDTYMKDFKDFMDSIDAILRSQKLTAKINFTLQRGTIIFLETMENIETMDELSRLSGTIRFKNYKTKEDNQMFLKPSIKSKDLNKRDFYMVEKEHRIVTLWRLIHLCNRMAHTYNHMIKNYIYQTFYPENTSEQEKTEKMREYSFNSLVNTINEYFETLSQMMSRNREDNSKRVLEDCLNRVNEAFDKARIEKGTISDIQKEYIDQLRYLRDNCYKVKDELLKYTTDRMKKDEMYSCEIKKYSVQNSNGSQRTENLIIFNAPGYGQFSFHIIDEDVLKHIYSGYNEIIRVNKNSLVIKEGGSQKRNEVQPAIPLKGISPELQNHLDEIEFIYYLIEEIANTDEPFEEKRKDVFKVLLNLNKYPIELIENILNEFDEKYGENSREI